MQVQQVLLLNNTYEVMNVCSIKRAMKLLMKGAVSVEEESANQIYTSQRGFNIPSVIKMNRYINVPRRKVNLTRKNIFLRDNHQCQYCGKYFAHADLTIDHLIPRAKGGTHCWENIVTACKKCNTHKGDKHLKDCGMPLLKKPDAPAKIIYLHIVKYLGRDNEVWKKYLFE